MSRVVALKNGAFFAVWTEMPVESGNLQDIKVKGRLYNADGTPRADEFLIGTAADGAELAVLADGRVAVSYTRMNSTGNEAHVRIYDPNGMSIGEGFRVDSPTGESTSPAIAALDDGGFVVAFSKSGVTSDGGYVQAFHANGARNGGEYLVDHEATYPSITVLADGRVAVAYQ